MLAQPGFSHQSHRIQAPQQHAQGHPALPRQNEPGKLMQLNTLIQANQNSLQLYAVVTTAGCITSTSSFSSYLHRTRALVGQKRKSRWSLNDPPATEGKKGYTWRTSFALLAEHRACQACMSVIPEQPHCLTDA